jgi:hypothetical protein
MCCMPASDRPTIRPTTVNLAAMYYLRATITSTHPWCSTYDHRLLCLLHELDASKPAQWHRHLLP